MSIPAQLITQLADALTNVGIIGGMAMAILAALSVFKKMHPAIEIKRDGNVYELDPTYEKKPPKYIFHEGKRYVLKSPPDPVEPYELDEQQDELNDEFDPDYLESFDFQWTKDEYGSSRVL